MNEHVIEKPGDDERGIVSIERMNRHLTSYGNRG